jgi:hypothetical protein
VEKIESLINFKEVSERVVNLHKALKALGYADELSQQEQLDGIAGSTTLNEVRRLQEDFNLEYDSSRLIDDITAQTINQELENYDLLGEVITFTVSGNTLTDTGEAVHSQSLKLYDVDLKGAAVYRTVLKISDVTANGGFEDLGTLSSDLRGGYTFTFTQDMFSKRERKYADLIVFAVAGNDIIGRSRLVNSDEYSRLGGIHNLDVIIEREVVTQAEYQALTATLNPFLDENNVKLESLTSSPDQIDLITRELDHDPIKIEAASKAELLYKDAVGHGETLPQELFYGLGRQSIQLDWPSLFRQKRSQLRTALTNSEIEGIIQTQVAGAIDDFLDKIQPIAAKETLDYYDEELQPVTIDTMLTPALSDRNQREAFMIALSNYDGDYQTFWQEHLPGDPTFQGNPELIDKLLFNSRLNMIASGYQPLVNKLQVDVRLTMPEDLLALTYDDWDGYLDDTGVPDHVPGERHEEKKIVFIEHMQNLLNASFPTKKLMVMAYAGELPIQDPNVADGVRSFLANNSDTFDIASSRISEFETEIQNASPQHSEQVKEELLTLQRVFQVSPSPDMMVKLIEDGLTSAYAIAEIPEKSFIEMYKDIFGGAHYPYSIHQKATFIKTRSEITALALYENSNGSTPRAAMTQDLFQQLSTELESQIPNYSNLFGPPNLCECKHCRSVYSPAAYFVDLMRFLWRSGKNDDTPQNSPLDMLKHRRPDLWNLQLTCENTHTLIPYIDLVNEIMEYYTANGDLDDNAGCDTGDTTAEELRANPQNVNLAAYDLLSQAVYPFTLPYHQPLDMMRIYSGHLKTNRYEMMKIMQTDFLAPTTKALEAEALLLSENEYTILTKENFNAVPDTKNVYEYFGYQNAVELEQAADVQEFLKRCGVKYTELVELLKTQFINPGQTALEYLEDLFSESDLDAAVIYSKLEDIESGALIPANDPDIMDVLNPRGITSPEFAQWVQNHFPDFKAVITLYQVNSGCDLATTSLRTLENVNTGIDASGIPGDDDGPWSKIHRFIRLWRKLGWSIHELDLVLYSLGDTDITPQTISNLVSMVMLNRQLKLPVNQLACLWGNIDTYGKKSLYKKLFLNKAVLKIDSAFEADRFGDFLTNPDETTEILSAHVPAVLAAFRMTDKELEAVLGNGTITLELDNGDAILNLANLSAIYRYVVLAKGLKLNIEDFLLVKHQDVFNTDPFSSPADTLAFCELVADMKKSKFKPAVLQYIFSGNAPAGSSLALDSKKSKQAAKSIRTAFLDIDNSQPDEPASPVTPEMLTSKLQHTFESDVVEQFMAILKGTSQFTTITDSGLTVAIPSELAEKYSYNGTSGRLTCQGVMTDTEKTTLESLNANSNYHNAVDLLYDMPEDFIKDHFYGVFASDMPGALLILLNRSEQTSQPTPEEKAQYVYLHYVPLLKNKLSKDVLVAHIAPLAGLDEAVTAELMENDLQQLVDEFSQAGYSAAYFGNSSFTGQPVLERIDSEIDFAWGTEAPDPQVPADQFSVRWDALIAPPATEDYTLVVKVQQEDEAFTLYVDEAVVLQKSASHQQLLWEVEVPMDVLQMYRFRIEYVGGSSEAGISLYWKTPTQGAQVIPSSSAFPPAVIDNLIAKSANYHRAAQFIAGFQLNKREIDHFNTFSARFADIDFNGLQRDHWVRINDYVTLRNALPQVQTQLVDVFEEAEKTDPVPLVSTLEQMLHEASAWDPAAINYLVGYFNLNVPGDFQNEIAFKKIYNAMQLISITGTSPEVLADMAQPGNDFNQWGDKAQLLKQTAKKKYGETDWLEIAGKLSDTLRENQKQALIQYLLMRPELQAWGVVDADSLFEYFLIDVQMGACMDTSRIVQANSAIQLFVTRCLLNLESNLESGLEKGVSPAYIDTNRWEWMKNYRVWEANRKVFLYPENWLEPEWRHDRSPFFKELESELMQNDINDRNTETAFRHYLTKLDQVSKLDVCGMYQDENAETIHVIARTHVNPYQYFYRTQDKYRKWSAWEKVETDIRCTEDGDDSGVHPIPVVWKKRLFLFWPEFIEKVKESNVAKDDDIWASANDKTQGELKAKKYWEIRLAWSEYVDNRWTPKQLSSEIGKTDHFYSRSIYFCAATITQSQVLKVYIYRPGKIQEARFELSDIQSGIEQYKQQSWQYLPPPVVYPAYFMKRKRKSHLTLQNHTYLAKSLSHKLLYSHQFNETDPLVDHPFFYSESHRTYFVRPVEAKRIEGIKYPEKFEPLIYKKFQAPIGEPIDPVTNSYDFVNTNPSGDIPAYGAMKTISSTGMKQVSDSIKIMAPFGGSAQMYYSNSTTLMEPTHNLEFYTFYHPFSDKYTQNLNEGGIPGLMASDTTIADDNGNKFNQTYNPVWNYVTPKLMALGNSQNRDRTFYKENVCFDPYGAVSIYNWELFFHAPLYIATQLSKNGKFGEAMKWFHYIFDPTTNELPQPGESETAQYWKLAPFKKPLESLQNFFKSLQPVSDPGSDENGIIGEWRDNPFRPHLVAQNRPLAYMKHVVIKYVENLVAWGDSLFRRDTMESINQATQLYVIANHILGPRPEIVPQRGKIKAETYATLAPKLDDFSNAIMQLENIFPYSSAIPAANSGYSGGFLGFGQGLYFCIPNNEKLLSHWDTVADRLFKIRHCMNIDGVERSLALFAPPIDPGLLISAYALGLSISDILNDLSSPPPIYRFTYLIRTALEFCGEVKSFGSTLLSALEKKDSEALALKYAGHETAMLGLITAVRERQLLEAKANRESLTTSRETARFQLQHYQALLGNDEVKVPDEPSLSNELSRYSSLPQDTTIKLVNTDVDDSLEEVSGTGVKLIPREQEDLNMSLLAVISEQAAAVGEGVAGILKLFPDMETAEKPFGIGVGQKFGGSNWGAAASSFALVPKILGSIFSYQAGRASKMAGYIRREQEWTFQVNQAIREIVQLDKQIVAADIRVQAAQKDLDNHLEQIKNAEEIEKYLETKFTNQELYQWMKEHLKNLYKESYNLAYSMAKKAEKAYRFETGNNKASFIKYGYWDESNQGLMSGEQLSLALKQLENSYIEENKRELELTKHISVALLNPLALLELKETGKCYLTLPEELFDFDFQGHYFRRIKSVSMSIPCIAGPYTTVNCSLRLLKNTTRITTLPSEDGPYVHNNDSGIWIDDTRFRDSIVPVTAIATSSGQNDSGMFEFNFRDERYMPFEGAGVISQWQIELTTKKDLRQFDYSTISDIIFHLNYTAREDAGQFKEDAINHMVDFLENQDAPPLMAMFSLKQEFSTQWQAFLYPAEGEDQVLTFTLGKKRFPFFAQHRDVVVTQIDVFARISESDDYHLVLDAMKTDGSTGISTDPDPQQPEPITLSSNSTYGELKKVTLEGTIPNVTPAGTEVEDISVLHPVSLRLKQAGNYDYKSLTVNPDEVEDIFLVLHYRLETQA